MIETIEQPVIDFYMYPPIGDDDWRYAFQTAKVRSLETQMLSKAALLEMVNAERFESAADLLSATEYALPHGSRDFAEVEGVLQERRSAARELFAELMIDKPTAELFRTRDDFANLRLVLRRTLTDKPLGDDYNREGNVSPEIFPQVFEEENYDLFPDYMTEVVEQAILAYYQNKDIREIDYAIDKYQAGYNLKKARQLKSLFLIGLFRIQIDLTNIRTMLRLKFTESEQRNVFLEGGFIELERLEKALDAGYESQRRLRKTFQNQGKREEARKFYYLERCYERKALFSSYLKNRRLFPRRKYSGKLTKLIGSFINREIDNKKFLIFFFDILLFHLKLFIIPKYLIRKLKFKLIYFMSLVEYIVWGYGEKPAKPCRLTTP